MSFQIPESFWMLSYIKKGSVELKKNLNGGRKSLTNNCYKL